MFGFYIKGRGWVKTLKNENEVICCRNFADVHAKFKFKLKTHIQTAEIYYNSVIGDTSYEIRTVSGDDLIDKRVVPSKKISFDGNWETEPFKLTSTTYYYRKFCSLCSLTITEDEDTCGDICIHCMMAMLKIVKKRYATMDDDIKESWERAKLMDEI